MQAEPDPRGENTSQENWKGPTRGELRGRRQVMGENLSAEQEAGAEDGSLQT